eukprot:c23976_g1_i2 orf=607-1335(-)
MMGSRHWQQRRTGRVRRRLQYANFIFISNDCDSALLFGQGESSRFSSDKVRLTEGSPINADETITATSTGSRTCLTSENGNDVSAESRSPSQSIAIDSDVTDTVNSENTWAEPVVHVSPFEKGIRMKSCSLNAFHGGSKEDLLYGQSKNCSTKESSHLDQLQINKIDATSLGRSNQKLGKTKEQEQRRGTRKRKPKVPFQEEESSAQRPQRKLRRIRIMRHLGLAAPYGSPFISSCVVRTTA